MAWPGGLSKLFVAILHLGTHGPETEVIHALQTPELAGSGTKGAFWKNTLPCGVDQAVPGQDTTGLSCATTQCSMDRLWQRIRSFKKLLCLLTFDRWSNLVFL
jgi:hypothetical protein